MELSDPEHKVLRQLENNHFRSFNDSSEWKGLKRMLESVNEKCDIHIFRDNLSAGNAHYLYFVPWLAISLAEDNGRIS